MRKLSVFNSVSVDGYFTDAKGDMSLAHRDDPEMAAFAAENASGEGALFFVGSPTTSWSASGPPPRRMPRCHVADGMYATRSWCFPHPARGDLGEHRAREGRPCRRDAGQEAGSRSRHGHPRERDDRVAADRGAPIDEYQLAVIPVVLGGGRTLFEGVSGNPDLELVSTRTFHSGTVLLVY